MELDGEGGVALGELEPFPNSDCGYVLVQSFELLLLIILLVCWYMFYFVLPN